MCFQAIPDLEIACSERKSRWKINPEKAKGNNQRSKRSVAKKIQRRQTVITNAKGVEFGRASISRFLNVIVSDDYKRIIGFIVDVVRKNFLITIFHKR